MREAERFYRERDKRSSEYRALLDSRSRPVHVAISRDAAASPSGQLLLLALVNQLSRGYRRITFGVPDEEIPVLVSVPFASGALAATVLETGRQIDPYGSFTLGVPTADSIVLGIGQPDIPAGSWYLSARGAVGGISQSASTWTSGESAETGAGVAACLGAAAAWRIGLGMPVGPWELALPTIGADPARASRLSPSTADPGRVLMVGAGAVGNAVAYWAKALGVAGEWTIVDGDDAELSNTNRGLCMTPRHTDWFGGPPLNKAEVVAEYMGAHPVPKWFEQANLHPASFDVVLALANGRDVRPAIASLSHPLVLHATTGQNWNALAHRHIAFTDDCIGCRMREQPRLALACSTATVTEPDGTSRDAALPFLSAAAGLMLVGDLCGVAAGWLAQDPINRRGWWFDFQGRGTQAAVCACLDSCQSWYSRPIYQATYGSTRWASLGK